MPYSSKEQRKWMHIHKPEIAKEWDKKYGSKIVLPKKTVAAIKKAGKKK